MSTIANIFHFIDNQGFTVRKFEEAVGFPNGTLNAAKKAGAISTKNAKKIVEVYSTQLKEAGYEVVDLGIVADGEIAILNSTETDQLLKQIKKSYGSDNILENQHIVSDVNVGYGSKMKPSMMELLIEEKEKVIAEKERLINEKNSHLKSIEENKREWAEQSKKLIDQNKQLLDLVQSGINNLAVNLDAGNRYQAAWQHFWKARWAEQMAKASPGKSAEEFVADADTSIADMLEGTKVDGSPSVEGTPDMQGSQTS